MTLPTEANHNFENGRIIHGRDPGAWSGYNTLESRQCADCGMSEIYFKHVAGVRLANVKNQIKGIEMTGKPHGRDRDRYAALGIEERELWAIINRGAA